MREAAKKEARASTHHARTPSMAAKDKACAAGQHNKKTWVSLEMLARRCHVHFPKHRPSEMHAPAEQGQAAHHASTSSIAAQDKACRGSGRKKGAWVGQVMQAAQRASDTTRTARSRANRNACRLSTTDTRDAHLQLPFPARAAYSLCRPCWYTQHTVGCISLSITPPYDTKTKTHHHPPAGQWVLPAGQHC